MPCKNEQMGNSITNLIRKCSALLLQRMNVRTHTAILSPEKYGSQTTDRGVDKRQNR